MENENVTEIGADVPVIDDDNQVDDSDESSIVGTVAKVLGAGAVAGIVSFSWAFWGNLGNKSADAIVGDKGNMLQDIDSALGKALEETEKKNPSTGTTEAPKAEAVKVEAVKVEVPVTK